MSTASQFRQQLLRQEFAERLAAPVELDTSTDKLQPSTWFLTFGSADSERYSVSAIEIVEELTHQELAGVFADAAAEHDGDHGHARCLDTDEVVFFGTDATALAEYANSYLAMRQKHDRKGKGFA